jgi:hypothetical protein
MRVVVSDGSVTFVGPVPAGSVAYVDADQLPAEGEAEIEVLTVPDGGTVDDRGARAISALAAPVMSALAAADGAVEVMGAGAVAQFIREHLLASQRLTASAPAVVIDLTGNPDVIADAIRRVGDLGTIVLAGEPAVRSVDLDFYPDVHVRGLHLVGIRRSGDVDVGAGAPAKTEAPTQAQTGQTVRAGGLWYRVAP